MGFWNDDAWASAAASFDVGVVVGHQTLIVTQRVR